MSEEAKKDFMEVYPIVRDEVLDRVKKLDVSEVSRKFLTKHYKDMVDYNVPKGKMTRGLTVKCAAKAVASEKFADAEFVKKVHILGWCVELLQAVFLVADDIMDGSKTRRGSPCWYLNEDIGASIAIIDSMMLQTAISRALRMHFRDDLEKFALLNDLFLEATEMTIVGQFLDSTQEVKKSFGGKLGHCTPGMYRDIVVHKTAFYTFNLPCALGLVWAGVTDAGILKQVEKLSIEIGEYFQVQDDYLDCYGDYDVMGKIGTDIQDGKCTWLVCQALAKGSQEDREALEENYGRDQASCVEEVRKIYDKLDLRSEYSSFEEESKKKIDRLISELKKPEIGSIFEFLLSKIYKRVC